jgi:hypothetical protein
MSEETAYLTELRTCSDASLARRWAHAWQMYETLSHFGDPTAGAWFQVFEECATVLQSRRDLYAALGESVGGS